MIKYLSGKLSEENKFLIARILDEIADMYSDFYITQQNLRLFIRENKAPLYKLLEQGDKIIFDEDEGIIFVTGFAEKRERKYIKILSKDRESADKLIKIALWHIKGELWAKVKKNNEVKNALEKNGFKFFGSRGKEILLVRRGIK